MECHPRQVRLHRGGVRHLGPDLAQAVTTAIVRPRPRGRVRPRGRGRLAQVLVFAGLVAVWWLAAAAGSIGAVPTPPAVVSALVTEIATGAIWQPLGLTIASWGISFSIAVVLGVVIGLPLGMSRLAYRISSFVLDFMRTIPALVLVPLVVLLFGSKLPSTVLLAAFGAVWAVIMQTVYGVRDTDPVARDTFTSFRVRPFDRFFRLLLPSAAPYIATGVRLAAAICLLVTISAQIVIPADGIGKSIVMAGLGDATPTMYAYILLAGLLGVGINAMFERLESVVLRWHPAHRKEHA
ncbi:MAG: ABC transporter permease subunit [Microbacteriaceae bacterium]|nr:ABC transporter permease subunit [Microbacteriaceae bacterium]